MLQSLNVIFSVVADWRLLVGSVYFTGNGRKHTRNPHNTLIEAF